VGWGGGGGARGVESLTGAPRCAQVRGADVQRMTLTEIIRDGKEGNRNFYTSCGAIEGRGREGSSVRQYESKNLVLFSCLLEVQRCPKMKSS